MWTATIKEKGTEERGTYVDVEFTDGVKTVTERVIPQDIAAFKGWVKGRLGTFNCEQDLAEFKVGETAVKEEVVVQPTADELATQKWFADFRKMQEVDKLVDMGVFTGTETPIVTLKNRLKTNFKVEYLDLM